MVSCSICCCRYLIDAAVFREILFNVPLLMGTLLPSQTTSWYNRSCPDCIAISLRAFRKSVVLPRMKQRMLLSANAVSPRTGGLVPSGLLPSNTAGYCNQCSNGIAISLRAFRKSIVLPRTMNGRFFILLSVSPRAGGLLPWHSKKGMSLRGLLIPLLFRSATAGPRIISKADPILDRGSAPIVRNGEWTIFRLFSLCIFSMYRTHDERNTMSGYYELCN